MSDAAAASTLQTALLELQRGRLEQAQELLEQALDEGADPPEVHYRLGLVHLGLGALQEAADSFELAVHLRPGFGLAWLQLSVLHLREAHFAQAAEAAQAALSGGADQADSHNNLGLACRGLGRFDEALAAFNEALRCAPAHADARANLGLALRDVGRPDEALAQLETALRASPADGDLLWNLAVTRLASGDFAGGWADYEKRWQHPDALRRTFGYPSWDGGPLSGKTLLVYAEQGLGDQVMFASCVPDLLAAGARCVLECAPKLTALFARSFPGTEVIAAFADRSPDWRARLPQIDCQIALGSLPRVLKRDWASFPRHDGYLKADPQRVAAIRAELARLGPGPKIGISWRGGAARTGQLLRTLDVADLAPLWSLRGCHYLSLQYGESAADIARARERHAAPLHDWPRVGDDLDEAAALICALDLVVSVTTSAVHLTGALGREAWVLVPASPEWRYLLSGERMPWYPEVRLFRQGAALDWKPTVQAVAAGIATRFSLAAPA
jgi:tetratricopeptide (TPR) repeat protein